MLTYHLAACEQLGVEPAVTPEMLPRLDAFERRYGTDLPGAVREWYALHAARKVLHRSSFVVADSLNDANSYQEWYEEIVGEDLEGEVPQLLLITPEEESGMLWSVPTDKGHDPPVLIGIDEDPADPQWVTFTASYSGFIFARAWDWRTGRMPLRIDAGTDTRDIGERLVADGFRPLPSFHFDTPDPYPYPHLRFEAPGQRIGLNTVSEGSCVLAAETESGLGELVRVLTGYGPLNPASPGAADLLDKLARN